jgi:hypothetical protein
VIEKQLTDHMNAVLADEPPLGFDPDELVGRAVRQRRRTIATVGTSGAVLVIAVATAVATGSTDARRSPVGTPSSTSSSTPSTVLWPESVCVTEGSGSTPPLNFPGSLEIIARLDASAPAVIAAHLPGVTVQPSETGMIAYDCPPNVGTVYPVNGVDQSVMLYLIHARHQLDLAHDRYADNAAYQLVEETTAADGALIRTYRDETGTVLVVVRFGQDGMITEASVSGAGTLVANSAQLRALASDPELRF